MGDSTVMFRAAGPHDVDAIAALHADSWRRHYRGAFADSYLDGDVLSSRREVWAERLAEPDCGPNTAVPAAVPAATILAEHDGALLGFVHVVFDDDAQWGSLIDNLHVVYDRKRSGIGSALVARAARAVDESAATKRMYLWVLEQNTTAQAFYAARGGARVERVLCEPPGGDPSRLNGQPAKFRIAWPDVRDLLGEG